MGLYCRLLGRLKKGVYHNHSTTFMKACLKDIIVQRYGYHTVTLHWSSQCVILQFYLLLIWFSTGSTARYVIEINIWSFRCGNYLSGTVFWPVWLRLAGMKIGHGCEVSNYDDLLAHLRENVDLFSWAEILVWHALWDTRTEEIFTKS